MSFTVSQILEFFRSSRHDSECLIEGLSPEDCNLQSMDDVSPLKWHLAHTSWFYETFLLEKFEKNSLAFNPIFRELFNSYYNSVGKQFKRPQRSLLSRPSLQQVLIYRQNIDERVGQLLNHSEFTKVISQTIELGVHHEKQHQELMLMDIKHAFFQNPIFPAYRSALSSNFERSYSAQNWLELGEGVYELGHAKDGFSFDNEKPRHKVYLNDFKIASRLVTNGEYLEFMQAKGYSQPHYWLADGWTFIQKYNVGKPAYWLAASDLRGIQKEKLTQSQWYEFTLSGLQPLDLAAPVKHISYFEADAYASFRQARLPTEFEWELACNSQCGLISDHTFIGKVWQWTSSAYSAYPGFQPFSGEAGEYNGKFMSGQYVLRGGSYLTPVDHIRSTYRNFFYPHQRWMCSGIRLAS